MKMMAKVLGALAFACMVAVSAAACGDDSSGGHCPGKVCSNCGASGDCDVTCSGTDLNYCGHFGFFADPDLRCSFCAPPDYQF